MAAVVPLVITFFLFQQGSIIEILAYGSLIISLYWGPLVNVLLPEKQEYQKIKGFAGSIGFFALVGFLPAAFVGGILALVFDSEQARAYGILATLAFIYFWAAREKEKTES